MIATNINIQPIISRKVIAPPVRFQPSATKMTFDSTAKTDSKLIRIEAEVGSVYF